MLVFLSDVHFTDGTSGETIKAGAFRGFVKDITRMAEDAEALELEVVLLGDIFDMIRSEQWTRTKIRPWDAKSSRQETVFKNILQGILKTNLKSLEHLKELTNLKINGKKIPVRLTYLIGNHDWLINRYPSCRKLIRDALDITALDPDKELFPWEKFWDDYEVFARHGDIFDSFNYEGGSRDASSLGDAIVIELINRFPKEVESRLGNTQEAKIVAARLREIDNVRPYLEVPSWIVGILRQANNPEITLKVKECWNESVDRFFEIPFVKGKDKWYWPDMIDALEAALHITTTSTFEDVEGWLRTVPKKLISLFSKENYPKMAYQEDHLKQNLARYIVYGHTHDHQVIPLDLVPVGEERVRKMYFNTGTWRKVHVRTAFDWQNREFIGWHVLTYVCFYGKEEAKGKDTKQHFEVWNGALATEDKGAT